MVNLEETKYHVDFGEYYVRMTDKQKHYLVVRSVIDRILAGIALVILSPLFLIVSIAQKISNWGFSLSAVDADAVFAVVFSADGGGGWSCDTPAT